MVLELWSLEKNSFLLFSLHLVKAICTKCVCSRFSGPFKALPTNNFNLRKWTLCTLNWMARNWMNNVEDCASIQIVRVYPNNAHTCGRYIQTIFHYLFLIRTNVRRHAAQCAAADPTISMQTRSKMWRKSTGKVWNRFCTWLRTMRTEDSRSDGSSWNYLKQDFLYLILFLIKEKSTNRNSCASAESEWAKPFKCCSFLFSPLFSQLKCDAAVWHTLGARKMGWKEFRIEKSYTASVYMACMSRWAYA